MRAVNPKIFSEVWDHLIFSLQSDKIMPLMSLAILSFMLAILEPKAAVAESPTNYIDESMS
jgi:hypothetical protein